MRGVSRAGGAIRQYVILQKRPPRKPGGRAAANLTGTEGRPCQETLTGMHFPVCDHNRAKRLVVKP